MKQVKGYGSPSPDRVAHLADAFTTVCVYVCMHVHPILSHSHAELGASANVSFHPDPSLSLFSPVSLLLLSIPSLHIKKNLFPIFRSFLVSFRYNAIFLCSLTPPCATTSSFSLCLFPAALPCIAEVERSIVTRLFPTPLPLHPSIPPASVQSRLPNCAKGTTDRGGQHRVRGIKRWTEEK